MRPVMGRRGRAGARRDGAAGRFGRDEAGAASLLSLFGILICLMLAGIAVDTSNGWRNSTILDLTADVASHAGASVLASGGAPLSATMAAEKAIALNMPETRYGPVLRVPVEDVVAVRYDPVSNTVSNSPTEAPNAVSVTLRRNSDVKNPIPTLLLKIVGMDNWNLSTTRVTAVVPTRRCAADAGIFAQERAEIEDQNQIGTDYCIHAQHDLRIGKGNVFASGSRVSMPDLAACGGTCRDDMNPGIAAAMGEMNLLPEPVAKRIARLAEGFLDPSRILPEEAALFGGLKRPQDLSALEELGVPTRMLEPGSVVPLDPMQVGRARTFPSGFVYDVSCQGTRGAPTDRVLRLSGMGMGPLFEGSVLVTDCSLEFDAAVQLSGAVVISTAHQAGRPLRAEQGARVGAPDGACEGKAQSLVLSAAPMDLPPSFTAANGVFLSAEDIVLEADPLGLPALHRGAAFHADGSVHAKGVHTFSACPGTSNPVLPELQIIQQVLPSSARI